MKHRKIVNGILSTFCLGILIVDGKTAFDGAAAGIDLCLRTVIPSLFPFLFLCSVLTSSLWGNRIPGSRYLNRILGIPEGAESLLISGFLGGYPAGAQAIGEGYLQKRLSKESAEHLLHFCSNAGPAFLFGMTSLQFQKLGMVWALWGIQIAAALITGVLYAPKNTDSAVLSPQNNTITPILLNSIKIMAIICGWILLFRIFTEFLNHWILWLFPAEATVLIIGLLELSNGCCSLAFVDDISLRFILCSFMLSFGGLCIAMQTASVIGDLSFWSYLRGKLTQTGISLLFSWLFVSGYSIILLSLTAAVVIFALFRKKVVDFPRKKVYNADINSGGYSHAVS